MLSDLLGKNKPFDLIVSGDLHVTLAVGLLNRRVEAKLLVIYQIIAEYDTYEFKSIPVDIEGGRSRAV